MKKNKIITRTYLLLLTLMLLVSCATDPYQEKIKNDPHYTNAGFFDLHVCNWPGRDLFFLAVFSTFEYKNIESVAIFRVDGTEVGKFNLKTAKIKKTKNNKTKHIVISKFTIISKKDKEGWYKAEIKLKNGKIITAKDFIKFDVMPIVASVTPKNSTDEIKAPKKLSWQKVTGAGYYKVTIRDMWGDGKVIHASKLLKDPVYKLPDGLIKSGGWYSWRVNVRDVNEDVMLGDFNHGSLTAPAYFLTEDQGKAK